MVQVSSKSQRGGEQEWLNIEGPVVARRVDFFSVVPLPGHETKVKSLDAQLSSCLDLRAGIYRDDSGRAVKLKVVERVEESLVAGGTQVEYLPSKGLAPYSKSVEELLFGNGSQALLERRIATIQTLGGTGALRLGGDFLHRHFPKSTLYLSKETWADHFRIFERAGLLIGTYPYLDRDQGGVRFSEMYNFLSALPPQQIVLLQPCCHNPTGLDLSKEQWLALIDLCSEKRLIPLLDLAYQGFGADPEDDAWLVRALTGKRVDFLVASSFSKNMTLYNDRTGALSVVTQSEEAAKNCLAQLCTDVRASYSNPPLKGAAVVHKILSSSALKKEWEEELGERRKVLHERRMKLVEALLVYGGEQGKRFFGITRQKGFYAYTGLAREEVQQLKEAGILLTGSGRLCVASLPSCEIARVARALVGSLCIRLL